MSQAITLKFQKVQLPPYQKISIMKDVLPLANAERFISKALKEYEDIVLHANDQIISLEYELFSKIKNRGL